MTRCLLQSLGSRGTCQPRGHWSYFFKSFGLWQTNNSSLSLLVYALGSIGFLFKTASKTCTEELATVEWLGLRRRPVWRPEGRGP